MREIRKFCHAKTLIARITPAYAGNTLLWINSKRTGQGSPPRMREILLIELQPLQYRRDHPRVCGKYTNNQLHALYRPGSPPRMREIRSIFCRVSIFNGITPAYAGNTLKNSLYYAITLLFNCIFHLLYLSNILGRLVILLMSTRMIFASSSAL